MRPFLFLGAIALLTTWLLWPSQGMLPKVGQSVQGSMRRPALQQPPPPVSIQREKTASVEPYSTALSGNTKEPSSTLVHGKIFDGKGNQILNASVLVFYRSRQIARLELAEDSGEYSMELLGGEYYGFMADPATLNGGLLPAPKYERFGKRSLHSHFNPLSPAHFTLEYIQAESGVAKTLNLRVGLLGNAIGRVFDPYGNPVAGVSMRISGVGARANVKSLDAITNEQGFFEIHDIADGEFRLTMSFEVGEDEEPPKWSIPAPKSFTFSAGQTQDLGSIFLGSPDSGE